MLTNANTATRSFRELQFDLRAFLEAMLDICPMDSSHGTPFVEIRWADGSVDVVPTFDAISAIVGAYPSLSAGGSAVLSPSTDISGSDYRRDPTLLVASAGVACRIEDLSAPGTLTIVKGIIHNLSAGVIELASDVVASSLNVTGILSAEDCSADQTTASDVSTGTAYARDSLDLSRVRFGAGMRFLLGGPDISVCTSALYTASFGLVGVCRITGKFRYSSSVTENTSRMLASAATRVVVEVPTVKRGNDGKPYYDYVPTAGEAMPTDGITPFRDGGDASCMLLYPKKSVRYTGNMSEVYIRAVAPVADDNNCIVQVCNCTGSSIRACNVWMFTTTGGASGTTGTTTTSAGGLLASSAVAIQSAESRKGVVTALNYVTLPPYSSVDFLLTCDFAGTAVQVYMMPMRHLQ